MKKLTGILLAAGRSTRFGSNKLLFPLQGKIPLVVQAARRMQSVLGDIIAVVNPDDSAVIEVLEKEPVRILANENAESGIGSSIACGVQESRESGGWVIALGDMPYVDIRSIRGVAAGIQHDRSICAPMFGGQRGHPVGFGKAYADELMSLRSDEGAKHIIAANRKNLQVFGCRDQGVIADIDWPHDIPESI